RDRGIQPRARRAPRRRGQDISGLARRLARPAADGQLRQGISVRRGPCGDRLVEEPARAFRDYIEVGRVPRRIMSRANADPSGGFVMKRLMTLSMLALAVAVATMTQALQALVQDSIKAVNTRLDTANDATRKGFADQKVVIDDMGKDLRAIRERVDDTNV